jgi:hypothetical protein
MKAFNLILYFVVAAAADVSMLLLDDMLAQFVKTDLLTGTNRMVVFGAILQVTVVTTLTVVIMLIDVLVILDVIQST